MWNQFIGSYFNNQDGLRHYSTTTESLESYESNNPTRGLYMATGLPLTAVAQDLKFLSQIDKLRA